MAEEQKQPTAQEISEPQQPAAQAMESQATSQTPATRPAKNPKRVAAGKMVAERTRLAREAQKQAYVEKMAKENEKMAKENEKKSAPDPALVTETEPKPAAADSNGLSTNQWISLIGIGATLFATYVKGDDIKAFFGKKQDNPPELEPVVKESPLQPKKESPLQPKKESPLQPKKGFRFMD